MLAEPRNLTARNCYTTEHSFIHAIAQQGLGDRGQSGSLHAI